jgi:ArsR family transcriptional regulator, virulence genes transcriptional regulator
MPCDILREHAGSVTRLLKAVANERRLEILCELVSGELTVSSLQERIGLSQSALSQHLARMRQDHLVKTRRDAQCIYYMLDNDSMPGLLEYLESLAKHYQKQSPMEILPKLAAR